MQQQELAEQPGDEVAQQQGRKLGAQAALRSVGPAVIRLRERRRLMSGSGLKTSPQRSQGKGKHLSDHATSHGSEAGTVLQ